MNPDRGMTIRLNGRSHEAPSGATVLALLETVGLAPGQVAVEVNGRVVPRTEYARLALQADDVVEVVQFVGGG